MFLHVLFQSGLGGGLELSAFFTPEDLSLSVLLEQVDLELISASQSVHLANVASQRGLLVLLAMSVSI